MFTGQMSFLLPNRQSTNPSGWLTAGHKMAANCYLHSRRYQHRGHVLKSNREHIKAVRYIPSGVWRMTKKWWGQWVTCFILIHTLWVTLSALMLLLLVGRQEGQLARKNEWHLSPKTLLQSGKMGERLTPIVHSQHLKHRKWLTSLKSHITCCMFKPSCTMSMYNLQRIRV